MGAMDPHFKYFDDLVRIINFFQREQTSSTIDFLENIYVGEKCTDAFTKAVDLVLAFLGAPILVDGADLGVAAHRVRLFWTNILPPSVLQAALPTLLPPSPSLDTILKPYHIPTKPGHTDRPPFSINNKVGWERVCMPPIVSYLKSNAFRTKDNGDPGEGQVFNIRTNVCGEPDATEKEMLGFQQGDTAARGVAENLRAIRLGWALDSTTMHWLGGASQS